MLERMTEMKRRSFVIVCSMGILVGVLISVTFEHALHIARVSRSDGLGAGAEWRSFSSQERAAYLRGFATGYGIGAFDACDNTDRLFETKGPMLLKDGRPNVPSEVCKESLDQFTRMGGERGGKKRANYFAYSNVITEFYKRYPKYKIVPFSFLVTLMSDKNGCNTADELFSKLERHDFQTTF